MYTYVENLVLSMTRHESRMNEEISPGKYTRLGMYYFGTTFFNDVRLTMENITPAYEL